MPTTKIVTNYRVMIDLDIMQMLNLGEQYSKEALRFTNDMEYSPDRYVQCLINSLRDENQQVFLALNKGLIVGGLWGIITGVAWSYDCIAEDLFLYILKEYRGYSIAKELVSMMEKWAIACGAKAIHTGANSGIYKDNPAIQLYKQLGYESGGFNFYKSLKEE